MSVLIVGSVALDTVETPFGVANDALGGAATYASYAASLFTKVQMVGVIGSDFPEEHLELLRSRGIDLAGVERAEGKTFRWSGVYDLDLNQRQTRETHLNVFESFNPKVPAAYRNAKVVFLANINPQLQLHVLDQVQSPGLVLCDTMNLWIDTAKEEVLRVLQRVDVALMNDSEARQLCGTFNLIKAGKQLLRMGPEVVIIKKGEHGALMFSDPDKIGVLQYFSVPAYPVEEIKDPTGAGDCFAGGLCGYLDHTQDFSLENMRRAIVYGSVIASYNVEDFSINRLKEVRSDGIDRRYQELKSMTAFE